MVFERVYASGLTLPSTAYLFQELCKEIRLGKSETCMPRTLHLQGLGTTSSGFRGVDGSGPQVWG